MPIRVSLQRAASSRYLAIWVALLVLLLVGAVIAPTSINSQSLGNLIFFASILGLASIGQHLVIAVGGLDLSVGSQITLAAIVFAKAADSGSLLIAALLAILICFGFGLLNGVAVTLLRITPLVATLGVGGIALSAAYAVHGEAAPPYVPDVAADLAANRIILGAFALVTVACIVVAAVISVIQHRTIPGRRLTAVGDNPAAARVLGIRVDAYRVAAYAAGAVCFALAGLVLAGVAGQPGITLGSTYLLSSIAAVVVGGTLLGGGSNSVVATLGGALFITHLNNVTLSLQAPTAVQLIVQGAAIALAMALYSSAGPRQLGRWAGAHIRRATRNHDDRVRAQSPHLLKSHHEPRLEPDAGSQGGDKNDNP